LRQNSNHYCASTATACQGRSFILAVPPLLSSLLSVLLFALLFVGVASPYGHASSADGHDMAPRIISTNVCIDNILINIFGTKHVVAVSNLVDDALYSQVKFLDPSIERISFDAEEILRLNPSLVLISNFSNHRVVNMLKDSGVKMVTVPFATKLSDISQNIQIVGTAIKQQTKAKIAADAIDQHIGKTKPEAGVFALHVTSNNYIYGKNSLISDAIRYAGLASSDPRGFGNNPGFYNSERIIASNPDYLIIDDINDITSDGVISPNLRDDRYHPALQAAYPAQHRIKIDPRLWSCAHQLTPQIIDLIEQGARKK
jgi:iron complex transport system substrate-binding protein